MQFIGKCTQQWVIYESEKINKITVIYFGKGAKGA
jgi:hypothetical protein